MLLTGLSVALYHTGMSTARTERICASIPAALAGDLRRVARVTGRPVSRIVAAAIARELAVLIAEASS